MAEINRGLFAKRLKTLMNERGETVRAVGEVVGLSGGSISRYCAGEMTPKLPVVRALAEYFGVSPLWLMGLEKKRTNVPPLMDNALPVVNMAPIRVVGTVAAGYGTVAFEDEDGCEFADVRNPENYIYLKVKGESMSPHIKPGDLALIKRQSSVDSGDLAVVIVGDGEGTIKRLVKEGGNIILQPFNPEYPTVVLTKKEQKNLIVVGRVEETKRRW